MSVAVRYAPSPTGELHVGGARTAIYNWAFARHAGGAFYLRVEDTDQARSTLESERAVVEALTWLGLDWDPVPGSDAIPRQSERLPLYRAAVDQLLASGHAYRCICTPAEVDAMREQARAAGRKPGYDGRCRTRGIGADVDQPFCVRIAIPEEGVTRWPDLIAGPSGEDASEIDDFVIARSDGTPIYHMAVVVDDHAMGVSHVIRGREHMTSTPRQLLLYQGLGWEPPLFAHVPLLVEPSGRKLSKRDAAESVQAYRDRGFTPEAVLNFIVRLGWSHGDVEIFSKEELVRMFTLEGVGRSPSQVHPEKLLWLSQHYLKACPMDQLRAYVQPFLEREVGRPVEVDRGLELLLDLLRERSHTLVEMAELARFYLHDRIEPESEAARRHLTRDIEKPLADLHAELDALGDWSPESIQRAFDAVRARHGLALGKLAQPVRVAITGRAVSPGIFDTLALLGRERSLARIEAAVARLGS